MANFENAETVRNEVGAELGINRDELSAERAQGLGTVGSAGAIDVVKEAGITQPWYIEELGPSGQRRWWLVLRSMADVVKLATAINAMFLRDMVHDARHLIPEHRGRLVVPTTIGHRFKTFWELYESTVPRLRVKDRSMWERPEQSNIRSLAAAITKKYGPEVTLESFLTERTRQVAYGKPWQMGVESRTVRETPSGFVYLSNLLRSKKRGI